MTRLTILEYPDPRLRTKASPVGAVDAALRQLIDDLLETMYAAKGVGLAATQVNVHQRLLVADVSEAKNEPLVLVNPEVLSRDEIGTMQEGCLSVPGYFEDVNRPHRIRFTALDRDGRRYERDAEGLLAVCVQHEIDHLDGKLFLDRISRLKRDLYKRKIKKLQREGRYEEAASKNPAVHI